MKPRLSIVYMTYRPGGLDLLGSSLENQTDRDYELVVVDDLPGRPERGAASDYLENQVRVPLRYYGPSKPRNYVGTRMGLMNAMNTGFIKSRGDFVVFLHDYSALPPDAVERWKAAAAEHGPLTVLHGVAQVVGGPRPEFAGDVRTWAQDHVSLDGKWMWVPEEFELFFLGASARLFYEINGVDERGDYCGQWAFNSLLHQIRVLGYKIVIDRHLECLMVDHRAWDEGSARDEDTDWRIRGHHSAAKSEPRWKVPSPNPFKMIELREVPA